MTKASDNEFPSLLMAEQGSTPATPAAGDQRLFIDSADHLAKLVDETGAVTAVGGGGGSGIPVDGWVAAEAWTYVSDDGPTGVFSAASDVTAKYSPGMRVRYTQSATVKYGIITKVAAFGSGVTPITIYGGTDYTLANSAISATYYSPVKAPFGFNDSPLKWTESLLDTSDRSQSSPGAGTWYNPGALSLSIPIGAWRVLYMAHLEVTGGGNTSIEGKTTLSTANNSESDVDFTGYVANYANSVDRGEADLAREKFLLLAAKTSYFLNVMTPTSAMGFIDLRGDKAKTTVRAVCAYL